MLLVAFAIAIQYVTRVVTGSITKVLLLLYYANLGYREEAEEEDRNNHPGGRGGRVSLGLS